MFLKNNTAVSLTIGPFLDDTDGKTPETGLTIAQADVRLSKQGTGYTQKNSTTACTHQENGYYQCPLDAVDTSTNGLLRVAVHKTGALPVWRDFVVLPPDAYDALIGNSGNGIRANLIGGAANSITAAMLTDGLLTAAKIATGAVDADALASDAVNEIVGAIASITLTVNVIQVSGSSSAADKLEEGALTLTTGAAVTGTLSTTQMTTNLTEATNDHYNGRLLTFRGGALDGQQTNITDYDGATKRLTFTALTEAPTNGQAFVIS